MNRLPRRAGMIFVALILLASLVPLSQPFRHAAAWRVAPEHAAYVDRALTAGAAAFGMSREAYRGATRPQIERDRQQTCVTLATHMRGGDGGYQACYESRTLALISERVTVCTFGATRLWDRIGGWIW